MATITPLTWNNDANAKITVTIPKGLSLRSGSIKQNGTMLAVNNYAVAKNDDGTTTVEITGSPIAGQEPTETLDSAGLVSDVQAADNGGKGIEGTPITMELAADNDAETPSTATLLALSSGTGTDLTVESFRKKSLDVSLVNPPKIFNYSLASSASTLYPTEDLTYNLSINNNTSETTGENGIDAVNVLPYDGDSRGTSNLKSYKVNSLKLMSSSAKNARVYYTTSQAARNMDKISGSDNTAATNILKIADDESQVKWTECIFIDGVCNLPIDTTITAIKIETGAMASGGSVNVNYTLSGILPNNSAKSGKIGGDLAYMTTDGMVDPVAHVAPASTDVAGDTVGLSISSDNGTTDSSGNLTISKQLDANSLVKATIKADAVSATTNGSDFVVSAPRSMVGTKNNANGDKFTLNAFSDGIEPTTGQTGYSLQVDDNAWSVSQSKTILPGNTRQTFQTVFAASSSATTPADTYTGKITFTLTAKQ